MNGTMNMRNDAAHVGLSKTMMRCICLVVGAILLITAVALAILLPEASNEVVYQDGGATVDASHSDQGYIMLKRKSKKAQKARISLGKENYTYDLRNDGEFEVFPLQMGDGKYKVEVFEQVSGKKYSPTSALSFSATLTNQDLTFLYPSQFVQYTGDSAAVSMAQELCASCATDADKVGAVYKYMLDNFVYDYVLAATVQKGYLPNVDEVLAKKTGICFDFAALMATMLRSQDIPVQMAIGYADKTYHAWNNVLVDGTWYRYDVTMDICGANVKKYTTERVY